MAIWSVCERVNTGASSGSGSGSGSGRAAMAAMFLKFGGDSSYLTASLER